jgi:hypothetical protein
LIDTEVNLRKSKKGGVKAAVQMAAIIGASRRDALAAYRKAQARLALALGDGSLKGDGSFKGDGSLRGDGSLSGLEKTSRIRVREPSLPQMSEQSVPSARSGRTVPPVWVAVVGHPYTVYDRYISMDLLGKLEKRGIGVKTIEMVCHGDINRTAYGAAMHLARSGEVDGIICLTSFGCGIDSFVNDLIERKIKRESDIPFITMTIDEHSGEAGFNTRLEAFTDMLHWRRCNEDNIPTPGEHIYSCQINT